MEEIAAKRPARRPTHPGAIWREDVLPALGLTVSDAEQRMGVERGRLRDVLREHAPAPIDHELAEKFALLCENPRQAALWRRMQSAVDRWESERGALRAAAPARAAGTSDSLRRRMEAFLAGWIEDVPLPWRDALNGLSPAFDDLDGELTIDAGSTIFPGRKNREPDGAPRGSHIFHALDGLAPDRVRAVIIGQDPYPSVSQATGRAFEQGDLDRWTSRSPRPAASLRRIAQQLAVYRTGRQPYGRRRGGWARLRNDIKSGALNLQTPGTVFDGWRAGGVLLLNTALTLTYYHRGGHPHQTRGHIRLWAPVVRGICLHLARREDIPVVFLSWGKKAREFLHHAGIAESCSRPLRIAPGFPRTDIVDRDHPGVPAFLPGKNLPGKNVFCETDERLAGLMASNSERSGIPW